MTAVFIQPMYTCTECRFSFQCENLDPRISVKPCKGIVEAKNFKLISFKFKSTAHGFCTQKIFCTLNNSTSEELEVTLIGSSENSQVRLVDGSLLRFKPAAVGTTVTQMITLQNPSGASAWFEWNIPPTYESIVIIKPTCGLILGKQRIELSCSFCPRQLKQYQMQVPCHILDCTEEAIYQDHTALSQTIACREGERILLLTLEGEGLEGTVTIEPEVLDLGTIIVGSLYERKIILYNSSEGYLEYALVCQPTSFIQADAYWLNLDCPHGIIPARSSQEVMISFKPKYASVFHFEIGCKINFLTEQERSRKPEIFKGDKISAVCIFSSNALFPSLLISAARCEGYCASHIWHRLQLGQLNHLLSKAQYNIQTRNSPSDLFGLGTPLEFRSPIVWNFGKRNIGTVCTSIDVVLKSLVDSVQWRIRFWNDKEVDMENWVQDSEPVDDESHYMFVKEMNLFEVKPKQGCVSPGEEMHINLIYRHEVEGDHSLPAIMQIERGCSIPLWLCGRTLSWESKILTLCTKVFELKPVTIGDLNPPLQTFELMNSGQSQLVYEIVMSPLENMRKENYDFEILRCLNPKGFIPPFESVLLVWLFQPLEEKTYNVDVPIMVKEGEGSVLTIKGLGLHPVSAENIKESQISRKPLQGEPQIWLQVPATVSSEFLDYGSVIELSMNEKLVAIQNLLGDFPIAFSWKTSFAAENVVPGCLTVTPSSGVIDPGRSSLCKVTFTAGTKSLIFVTGIICYIRHVDDMEASYNYDWNCRLHLPEEEIIAKDWKRLGKALPKKKDRKSVTLSLTESSRAKLPFLKCDDEDVFGDPNEGISAPNSWTFCLSVGASVVAIHKSAHGVHEFLSDFFQPGEPSFKVSSTEDNILIPVIEDILQESVQDATRHEFDDGKILYFEQFQRSSISVEPKVPALEAPSGTQVKDISIKQETYPQNSSDEVLREMIDGELSMNVSGERISRLEDEDKEKDAPTPADFRRKCSLADAPEQVKAVLENLLFDTMKEFHDSAVLFHSMVS